MSIDIRVIAVGRERKVGAVSRRSEVIPFLGGDAGRTGASMKRGMSARGRERREEFVIRGRIAIVRLALLAGSSSSSTAITCASGFIAK